MATEHSRWTREACPCHVGFVVLPMSASRRRSDGGCHESVPGAGAHQDGERSSCSSWPAVPCAAKSTDTTKARPAEKRSNRSASSGTPTNGCRARWTCLAISGESSSPAAARGPDRIAAARPEVEGEVNVPEATDRQALSRTQPLKPRRWPRTERRQARIRSVLARRQPDLTVVLENVHDPHNVSAILRSCDGVGVLQAHAVYSIEEPPPGAFARQTSASAAKWVDVERHRSLTACYERLTSGWFRHSGHEHRAEFAPSL